MVCKEVIRKLSEFLDQELAPEVAADLCRHLDRCTDCSIVVDTTRKTIEIYCNTEPLPLPPQVRVRLEHVLAVMLQK